MEVECSGRVYALKYCDVARGSRQGGVREKLGSVAISTMRTMMPLGSNL